MEQHISTPGGGCTHSPATGAPIVLAADLTDAQCLELEAGFRKLDARCPDLAEDDRGRLDALRADLTETQLLELETLAAHSTADLITEWRQLQAVSVNVRRVEAPAAELAARLQRYAQLRLLAGVVAEISPKLVRSCDNGNVARTRELLNVPFANAAINQPDEDGNTPLTIACSGGYCKCTELLLASHAAVDHVNESGLTPLYITCNGGPLGMECAQVLLRAKASIDKPDKNGITPLFAASGKGFDASARLLVVANAAVDQPCNNGSTALFAACRLGHRKCTELLLASSATVDHPYKNSLHIACAKGNSECVQLLLAANAALQQLTSHGLTPLYVACRGGHRDCARMLLRAKAAVDQPDKNGVTPLHVACRLGFEACVQLLLSANAIVDQSSNDGTTPLLTSCSEGHGPCVQLLLAANASVNQPDDTSSNEFTPLMTVCFIGELDIVRDLLHAGACTNRRGPHGETALELAEQFGNHAVAQLLRCSITEIVMNGTAEALPAEEELAKQNSACSHGISRMDQLIRAVSSVRLAHPTYNTVQVHCLLVLEPDWADVSLSEVKRACSKAVKQHLIRPSTPSSAPTSAPTSDATAKPQKTKRTVDSTQELMSAVCTCEIALVKRLLRKRADPNQVDDTFSQNLRCRMNRLQLSHYSNKQSCDDQALTLSQRISQAFKARVAAQLINPRLIPMACTPLALAAQKADPACVAALIQARAQVDQHVDNSGVTALFFACLTGADECASLLIHASASVQCPSQHHSGPLSASCRGGHAKCAELLLDASASANDRDLAGWYPGFTPLHHACNWSPNRDDHGYFSQTDRDKPAYAGHEDCVRLLVAARAVLNRRDQYDGGLGLVGGTPLHWAAASGHVGIVRALVEAGASTNKLSRDDCGSPLGRAASSLWNCWDGIQYEDELLETCVEILTPLTSACAYCGSSDSPLPPTRNWAEIKAVDDFPAESQPFCLQFCNRCKRVQYCCVDHQKAHWPEHKPLCSGRQR